LNKQNRHALLLRFVYSAPAVQINFYGKISLKGEGKRGNIRRNLGKSPKKKKGGEPNHQAGTETLHQKDILVRFSLFILRLSSAVGGKYLISGEHSTAVAKWGWWSPPLRKSSFF
jgi:hypothetical protein